MGYVREKYTAEYYLRRDKEGKLLPYGVDGIEEFHRGTIRADDRDILERIDFRGKLVLDVGCGRGEALKFAAEHGAAEIHGVDFSETAIAIAREFLRQANIGAELHLAEALDFLRAWGERKDSARFDVVTMLDCVEHIPRSELSMVLQTLLPSMAPRGILAVHTGFFPVDNDLLVEGLKPASRDATDEYEATKGMHCNRYTRRSLRTYLRRHGFGAISERLFVAYWLPPRLLETTLWARRKATRLGYPVLLPRALEPERGVTWRTHPALTPVRWVRRLLRNCIS